MLDPISGSVLIGGKILETGMQVAQGLTQKNQAKKLKKSNYIPPELRKQLRTDERKASINQTKRQQFANRKLKEGTAEASKNIMKVGGSTADVVTGLASIEKQKNDAILENEAMAEGDRERAEDRLRVTRGNVARIEQKNQDEYEAAKSALEGAADQNIFNAITNVSSTASFIAGAGGISKGKVGSDGMYTPPSKTTPNLTPGLTTERRTVTPSGKLVIPRTMSANAGNIDITDYLQGNQMPSFSLASM